MSQQALATASGVHWTTISRIERGEMAPTWTILRRLADSLKLSIFLMPAPQEDDDEHPSGRAE